jgi:hypothetical protein
VSEIPSSAEAPVSRRANDARPTAAVFLAALLFYAVFIFRTSFVALGQRWFVLFEDAMISMRYARNFASGAGLVWNAGEQPVEGYTNFLWTLWMSVVHRLGLPASKISLVIMLTGVVILVSNALIVRAITREVTRAPWAPLAATTATLFFYPLVFWTLRGMEVGALTLLVDALLLLAFRLESRWTFGGALSMGLIAGAAFLLRSDSAVCCGLISAYAILVTPGAARFATAGIIGGFFGAAVVGQGIFRRETYGETLPNTYYLKLLHVPLGARLKRGIYVALQVLAFQLAVPLAALAGALVGTVDPGARKPGWWTTLLMQRSERRLLLLGAIVALQLAYATYVGGDAWEWMLYANRYTTVGMPALIVLGMALLARLIESTDDAARVRAVRAAALVLALAGLVLLGLNAFAKVAGETGVARTIVVSKSTAAGGVALLILGGLVYGPLGGLLRRGLVAARSALSTPAPAVGATLALVAIVWGPAQLQGMGSWALRNAAQYADEANYTREGLLIRAATGKSFRIAVVAAGATPYFCDRPSEDLLGKNDSVIAHRAPSGVFSPGHDKWDYRYSIGQRHPDLIVELADTTDDDIAYIKGLGFHQLPNGMWLRGDAEGVDAALIGREVKSSAELDAALDGLDPDEFRRGGPERMKPGARR